MSPHFIQFECILLDYKSKLNRPIKNMQYLAVLLGLLKKYAIFEHIIRPTKSKVYQFLNSSAGPFKIKNY